MRELIENFPGPTFPPVSSIELEQSDAIACLARASRNPTMARGNGFAGFCFLLSASRRIYCVNMTC